MPLKGLDDSEPLFKMFVNFFIFIDLMVSIYELCNTTNPHSQLTIRTAKLNRGLKVMSFDNFHYVEILTGF